jgi:hypothetical protein
MKITKDIRLPRYYFQRIFSQGDCRIWEGMFMKGQPYVSIHICGAYKMVNARHLWFVCNGGEIPFGHKLEPTCGSHMCVRPDHQHITKKVRHGSLQNT